MDLHDQPHLQNVRQHWDKLATEWNDFAQKRPILDQRWEDWQPSLRSFFPSPAPSVKVLDAGCGAGQLSTLLAYFGFAVKGCDLSQNMLDYARHRAASLPLASPIEFTLASIDQLPYEDGEFDWVICHLVVDFTPRPAHALHELRRVTKEGGKLLLATLGANSPIKDQRWQRFLKGLDPVAVQFKDVFNGITPWEVESLLPVMGWRLLQHEGLYTPSVSGIQNPLNAAMLEGQPIVFQQLAASVWRMVAEAVAPQPLAKQGE